MSNQLLFLFLTTFIGATHSALCSWSSWSTKYECRWVKHHCVNAYIRNCLCYGQISPGSYCGNNDYYIETKPFVSNFYSPAKYCTKSDCPYFTNWCEWDNWSVWSKLTNITCTRKRTRKCCKIQPKYGYTIKMEKNQGCFVNRTYQMAFQDQQEVKERQCSEFVKWIDILIYSGAVLGGIIIFITICLCTGTSRSKSEIGLRKQMKFNNNNEVNREPMPELVEQNTATETNIPMEPVVINEPISEKTAPPTAPDIPINNLPASPPSYNDIIPSPGTAPNLMIMPGTSTNILLNQITEPEMKDRELFLNTQESTGNFIEDQFFNPNTDSNIPPPSYSVTARNPNLFEAGCNHI